MKMRQAVILAGAAALLASVNTANAENWSPDPVLISNVEKGLVLPKGANPMVEYNRYYFGTFSGGKRILSAVFLREKGPGSVKIIKEAEAPQVLDGGCSVIHLKYDADSKKIISLFCNGDG
jgi:hypothetical protein